MFVARLRREEELVVLEESKRRRGGGGGGGGGKRGGEGEGIKRDGRAPGHSTHSESQNSVMVYLAEKFGWDDLYPREDVEKRGESRVERKARERARRQVEERNSHARFRDLRQLASTSTSTGTTATHGTSPARSLLPPQDPT